MRNYLHKEKYDAGDYAERSIKYLWPHHYVMHSQNVTPPNHNNQYFLTS